MIFRILLAAIPIIAFMISVPVFGDDEEHGSGGGGDSVLPVINHPSYLKECSACHMAYQPELLPARSWKKLMDSLEEHFGDNAGLDAATRQEILKFLVSHSAESSKAEISRRILASIPSNFIPLRISKTDYIIRKHREVSPSVFKRKSIGSASNCAACHSTADNGNYDEDLVKIPR
ncbi:MAG: diheme cytochrome c [Nitrospiria bacterium]